MNAVLRAAAVAMSAAVVTAGVVVVTGAPAGDDVPNPPATTTTITTTTTTTIPQLEGVSDGVALNCEPGQYAVLIWVPTNQAMLVSSRLTSVLGYPVMTIDGSLCQQGTEYSTAGGESEKSETGWHNPAPGVQPNSADVQLVVGPFESEQSACHVLRALRERVDRTDGADQSNTLIKVLNNRWYVGEPGSGQPNDGTSPADSSGHPVGCGSDASQEGGSQVGQGSPNTTVTTSIKVEDDASGGNGNRAQGEQEGDG